MRADLGAFLRRMASEAFLWGMNDCALVVADWWLANYGHDPAAHLRGAYADREACHALLAREGGLLRLVTRLAHSVGAERATVARAGDFGVIRHNGAHVGAIRTATGRWAIKGEGGIVVVKSSRVAAAWHV